MLRLSWAEQVQKTGVLIAWDTPATYLFFPVPLNLSYPIHKSDPSICQTSSFQNSPHLWEKKTDLQELSASRSVTMIGGEPKIKRRKFGEFLGTCECDSEVGHAWENRTLQDDLKRGERTVLQLRWAAPFLQNFFD